MMRAVKMRARALAGCLIGHDIERLGSKSVAFVNKRRRPDAWFSYRAQLRSIIEGLGIDVVIDVGANAGQFARSLRPFYRGEILSFEPEDTAFAQLAEAAGSDPKWRVFRQALGAEDSARTLHVSDATDFSSLLQTNEYCLEHFGDRARSTRMQTVPVRRLDGLLDGILPDLEHRRIFLKMDTQGSDAEVFAGMGGRLSRVLALQSEVSLIPLYAGMPHWTQAIGAYEQAGFGIAGMFPVSRDSFRVIEYDCLLVKAGPDRRTTPSPPAL